MGWLGGCRRAGLGVGASQCSPFVLPAASPAARGGDPAGKCALGTAKGQPRGTSRIHWVSGWAKLRSVKLIPWLWLDPTSSTASSFPTLFTVPHSVPWFESRWIGAWSWSLEHSIPLTFENNPRFVTTPRLLNLPRPGSCPAPPGQPCQAQPRQEPHQYFRMQPGSPGSFQGPRGSMANKRLQEEDAPAPAPLLPTLTEPLSLQKQLQSTELPLSRAFPSIFRDWCCRDPLHSLSTFLCLMPTT